MTRLLSLLAMFFVLALPVQAETLTGGTAAFNALRTSQGLGPVTWSRTLQRAAEMHAKDMAKRGYFSHADPQGRRLPQRLNRVRYRNFCFAAENIAKGQTSVAQVMGDWTRSRAHRANMVQPRVNEYGLAVAGDVWVMVVGAKGCRP
ncbi:CAP domain-containing protein [Pseudaestuariivita sp.]|uniref:CAP domain-containing protein n=1 Tax=Pseudaestuariivita sp. TaxID=2211669 RepID=UPI004059A4D2